MTPLRFFVAIDVIEVLVSAMHFGRSPYRWYFNIMDIHNGYSHMRNLFHNTFKTTRIHQIYQNLDKLCCLKISKFSLQLKSVRGNNYRVIEGLVTIFIIRKMCMGLLIYLWKGVLKPKK